MNDALVIENLLLNENITKKELADKLGVNKQLISFVTTGKRKASKSLKEKISSAYPYVVFYEEQTEDSDWFIAQRKTRNLSRQEFSDLIGISLALCTKIELGERRITPKLLAKIKSLDEDKLPAVAYINFCPNSSLPNYCLSSEKFAVDKRIIQLENFNIEPNDCYLIRANSDDLQPMFNSGDMVIIVSSIKRFLSGHIYSFEYNNQHYIRKIVLLPDKIKCISLSCEEDTFYLEDSTKGITIFGLIIPKFRL
jgi:transcriptional regulator with XRE-family HTH domain